MSAPYLGAAIQFMDGVVMYDSGAPAVPVNAMLGYEPNEDAHSVCLVINQSLMVKKATFHLSRDLLWAGLSSPVTQGENISMGPRGLGYEFAIKGAGPEGEDVFMQFPFKSVYALVHRAFSLVPQGEELRYVDVDRALENILKASS